MNIRVLCPDCGEVVIGRENLQLRVCLDIDDCTYCYICPLCAQRVVKEANDQVVQLLVRAGIELKIWHYPAELTESAPTGEPIAYDDILDFHNLLQDSIWLEEQVQLCQQTATKLD